MPSLLSVHLVRHGETGWNRDGRCQGITDIALTAEGLEQAGTLGHSFAAKRPDLILSSPLQRALETARRIAAPHGLACQPVAALRKWDQGALEGLTGARLLSDNTAFFHRWQQNPAHTPRPSGETLQAVQGRAWPVVDQVRERTVSGSVWS